MKKKETAFYASYVNSSVKFKRLQFVQWFLNVVVDDVYTDIIDDISDELDAFSEWVMLELKDYDSLHPVEIWQLYCEANNTPRFPNQKLKALVLAKSNYCCTRCGSTERLHIDHIHPWSKGGRTVLNNLTVLCEKCNLQKSAKD